MAGDWIKVEVTTPDKPEIFRMAEALEIDPDAVVGKLIRVWVWADQQTTNGNAPSVTRLLLDRLTNVSGFANSMISVGWLHDNGDGLTFTNFDRHNLKTGKTRALTRNRVENHRNAVSVTNALPEKRRGRDRDISNKGVSEVSVSKKARPKRTTPIEYPPEFLQWYQSFPRQTSQPKAYGEFESAVKRIVASRKVERGEAILWLGKQTKTYAESVADSEARYIKTPANWLKEDCFNDQLTTKSTPRPVAKPLPSMFHTQGAAS